MTSRSLRMSEEDFNKTPGHCSLALEQVPSDCDGRRIPEFIENFPLGRVLKVDIGWGWERAAFKVLIAAENQLIREAEAIRDEAVELFREARKYDNRSTPNLGIKLRVRPDTLGPRIYWVRFTGKGQTGALGQTQYYTEPVKLAGKFRTSKKIFVKFPDGIRTELEGLEERAAHVRYQVEKLGRFKKIIYELPEPSK